MQLMTDAAYDNEPMHQHHAGVRICVAFSPAMFVHLHACQSDHVASTTYSLLSCTASMPSYQPQAELAAEQAPKMAVTAATVARRQQGDAQAAHPTNAALAEAVAAARKKAAAKAEAYRRLAFSFPGKAAGSGAMAGSLGFTELFTGDAKQASGLMPAVAPAVAKASAPIGKEAPAPTAAAPAKTHQIVGGAASGISSGQSGGAGVTGRSSDIGSELDRILHEALQVCAESPAGTTLMSWTVTFRHSRLACLTISTLSWRLRQFAMH